MLLEFSVTNFRSIHSRQTLSLVAGPGNEHLGRNVTQRSDDVERVLRSAVLLGPNASGKSNFFRALQTLQQLVVGSSIRMQEGQRLAVTPFLLARDAENQPSEFDIVFVGDDGVRYEYCAAVTADRVHSEWMVAYPKGRPQRWFEREYKQDTDSYEWWFGPSFKGERAERKVWQDFTRANALFFSTAIQLNNEQLKLAFHWISQKLIVVTSGIDLNPALSISLLREPDGDRKIMQFMRAADIGIARMELLDEDVPDGGKLPLRPGAEIHIEMLPAPAPGDPVPPRKMTRIRTWHARASGDEVAFDLFDESEGTRRLFQYAGGYALALSTGATVFVDELDRSLHPHITRFLVGLFHGKTNTTDAQLIFTTHDATLLDTSLIRRDQIWFVEKDEQQASRLYPLLDYSPRKDEALERGYLKGRYGAVPKVGSLGD